MDSLYVNGRRRYSFFYYFYYFYYLYVYVYVYGWILIVILLLQRLKALDDGWEDVQRMWSNKQTLLSQSLNLQVFLRDAKQAEVMLSQQDNFLSKEEVPVSNL